MELFNIVPLPVPLPQTETFFSPQICLYTLALCAAALSGWIMERSMSKKFRREVLPLNILLPVTALALLILRFGAELDTVKGFIFCLTLLYAADSDLRTCEVDDSIPLMIVITALIGVQIENLPEMFFASAIITLPQLIIAVYKPGTWGGADIKIMAAYSFLLGLDSSLFAMIAGLLLGVIVTTIRFKLQKKTMKESFTMIPYLAIGSFIAYII